MSTRKSFLTATIVASMVLAGSTPVQAADADAVTRAIVITVLNNLGVQPTSALVDALVADIPMDVLDSRLVRRVGTALDTNGDTAQIISQTVDSDDDGVPNENGSTDASSGDNDDDVESGSNSGSSSSGGGSSTRPPNNAEDDEADEANDEEENEANEDEDDN